MSTPLDLDGYLHRIAYLGSREATLDTLRAVVRAHTEAVPFENLDPLLGRPVRLDLPSLQQKIVIEGRGGYCFEQNLLLRAALEALGYDVTGLAARVLWNQPDDAITARGHMLLLVDLDGARWIVDVGFGGQVLTGVLRLEAGTEQATPHEPFRLVEAAGGYLQQARIGDTWKTTYRFDLQPQYTVDYEVTSYFLSTHPSSHFRTSLVAARAASDRRYALRNRALAIHHLGGATERHTLASAAELREVLARDFRLAVPDLPELDATFDRLT